MNSEQRSVSRGLVDNFLQQWRKPFGVVTICEIAGVSKILAGRVVKEWIEAGNAKEIEPGIYVVCDRSALSIASDKGDWKYSLENAKLLLSVLPARSIREAGRKVSRSRQWAFKYLEALMSIGAVTWNGKTYMAMKRADLSRLGCNIEKGILGRVKKETRNARNAS